MSNILNVTFSSLNMWKIHQSSPELWRYLAVGVVGSVCAQFHIFSCYEMQKNVILSYVWIWYCFTSHSHIALYLFASWGWMGVVCLVSTVKVHTITREYLCSWTAGLTLSELFPYTKHTHFQENIPSSFQLLFGLGLWGLVVGAAQKKRKSEH